jgi:tRNA(Ile)-lysidine synthase
VRRIQNFVAKHHLWQAGDSFIVAVSGGADSLCLLDILVFLQKKYHFSLHIAHVNYGLRGKDSDADEKLVRARAQDYHLPLSVFHPRATSSSEEHLRDLRYRFFEKVRLKTNSTAIVVAHHQDDQAETLLLRLLRGSGMQGLSAMRPRQGHVIRPLLDTARKDILQYLKERSLAYRIDQSNRDPRFLRNRIRHHLLPLLEKEYQPQVKRILSETATLLATDYALLETLDDSTNPPSPEIILSASQLLTLPEAALHLTLRKLLKPFFEKKSPPQGVVNEVKKLLFSTKKKSQIITLRGLKIERKGDTVRLLHLPL